MEDSKKQGIENPEGRDKVKDVPIFKTTARNPILELASGNENIKIIHGGKGPEKRGIAAKKQLKVLQPINNFTPKLKTINSFPLESSNDSCKNVCQKCFVTGSFINDNEIPKFVSYSKLNDNKVNDAESFDVNTKMVTCKWCQIYKYCNQDCYDVHWNQIHQYECQIFRQLLNASQFKKDLSLPEFIRHGIRLYILCDLDQDYKSRVLDLTSHCDIVYSDTEYAWLNEYTNFIVRVVDSNMGLNLYNYIWKLLCITLVNSNVLMNEYQEAIGFSFDPDFSLLNHSCIPNTLAIPSNNSNFSLVATFPVAENKELFTNYCFTSCPKELRSLELQKRFYFTCNCSLCKQKFDLFFSYNCQECDMLLCGLTFDDFFSDDLTKGLIFRNKHNPDFCSNCGKLINKEQLKESRKCHQQLLAIMFHDLYNDRLDYKLDDTYIRTEDFYEKINKFTIDIDLFNFSGHKLIEFIDSFQFSTYIVSPDSLDTIKAICIKLRQDKIVPSYCFPLNHIISGFNEYDLVSSMGYSNKDKNHYIQCLAMKLKIDLQTYFEVKIPGDLTKLKISTMIYFKDISHQLLTLAEIVIKYSDESSILNEWLNDKEQLIETLIKCASFFNLQAIDAYLPFSVMNNNYKMLSQLINVGKQIKYLITSKRVKFIPKELCNWYNNNPSNFYDEMFVSNLTQLFKFADISIKYKNSRFNLHFADRNRKPIFKPVHLLTSKDMESLQATT